MNRKCFASRSRMEDVEVLFMVTRIHLKTACANRKELVDFCLGYDEKYLVIGWSHIYEENQIQDYNSYYETVKKAVKSDGKRLNPALNIFRKTKKDDLFWTRDLDGVYWICRAKGEAEPYYDAVQDIGARIAVEAYAVGIEVPGQIKASFNRPRGGITERIDDKIIVEYSKHIYNIKAGKNVLDVQKFQSNILDNLPDFELEELVISYIQLKENYYVLSNSIANKSTTIKIECEFISRDVNDIRKAVVQVKGGKASIDAMDYAEYVKNKYVVYLYAPKIEKLKESGCTEISRRELETFYKDFKTLLPESITCWEDLFK